MVKNNIDALRSVYLSLGGSLDDTHEDINGGSPVSAYRSVKDHIAAISKLDVGSGSYTGTTTFYSGNATVVDIGGERYGFNFGQLEGLDPLVPTVTVAVNGQKIVGTYILSNNAKNSWTYDKLEFFYQENIQSYLFRTSSLIASDAGDIYSITISAEITDSSFKQAMVNTGLTLPETDESGKILESDTSGKWRVTPFPQILPHAGSDNNGKYLRVVGGQWQAYSEPNLKFYENDAITLDVTNKLLAMANTIISSGKASDTIVYSSESTGIELVKYQNLSQLLSRTFANRSSSIDFYDNIGQNTYVQISIFSGYPRNANDQFSLSATQVAYGYILDFRLIVEKTDDTTITIYLYGEKLS